MNYRQGMDQIPCPVCRKPIIVIAMMRHLDSHDPVRGEEMRVIGERWGGQGKKRGKRRKLRMY